MHSNPIPFVRPIVLGTLFATLWAASATVASAQESEAPLSVHYDSGPLGRFAPGRWQRIQIATTRKGDGFLTLDPNRLLWDGYSPSWISTRMSLLRIPIRLREVKRVSIPNGKPKPASPIRVYDLAPTELPAGRRFSDFGLGAKARLALSNSPMGVCRLLLMDDQERITQTLPMERNQPAMKQDWDLIALKSGFLGGKLERASFITITGSLSAQQVRVILDPNAVTLDGAGDPAISTLMAPLPIEAKLTEKTDLPDEAKANVRVFTLEGTPKLMALVLPLKGGSPHLVLSDDAGKANGFLLLEPNYGAAAPLTNATWRLSKIAYNNDKTVTPEENGVYTLNFTSDGRVLGRANVNRILASYLVADEQIRILGEASTRAAALPGSVEPEFVKALGEVRSYKLQGDELWLMLAYDSGTMILKRETKGTPR